jgi:hypothetical protein
MQLKSNVTFWWRVGFAILVGSMVMSSYFHWGITLPIMFTAWQPQPRSRQ